LCNAEASRFVDVIGAAIIYIDSPSYLMNGRSG